MNTEVHWATTTGETAAQAVFGADTLTVDMEAPNGSGRHATPHDLIDAALAACTTLTLQLYVKHKRFDVQGVRVEVSHSEGEAGYLMHRVIHVTGTLTPEQQASVLRIANVCPVHKTLTGHIGIQTDSTVQVTRPD